MWSNIKRLVPMVGKYKYAAFLAPITIIVEVILEINIPLEMSRIVDEGIPSGDIDFIMLTGGKMLLLALGGLVCGTLSGTFASIAGAGLAKGIRQKVFYAIQDFSFGNIDHFSSASLITRLTTDISFIQQAFMMAVRSLFRGPIMMIGATYLALQINRELGLIYVVAIPILALSIGFVSVKAHPLFRVMFKKFDAMNAVIQENLIAIRVVKSFVRGDFEEAKFEEAAGDVMNAQRKAEHIVIFNMPIMMFMINICIIAVVWFGGNKVIVGDMQTGELMSFITYTQQILIQMQMISMILVTIVISQESMDRLVEVLKEKAEINDDQADPELKVENGDICFDDVCFSYTDREDNLTLEHINLNIESGQIVGILGGTGSSKTTLVQLLPRLYDVYSGSVLIGGHDVRDYKLTVLRDAVSIVLQKNVLFSGTIRDNLLWGDAEADDADIEKALRAAQAYDFVMSFPEGLNTWLGQGGVNVSGGQKQRLCIARALLKNPKVLILDDSTSAVDTATDAKIREAFKTYYSGVTVLIIAQRVASVQEADQIIVMNNGEVNSFGTHAELMETNEIYREVFESQAKGVGD